MATGKMDNEMTRDAEQTETQAPQSGMFFSAASAAFHSLITPAQIGPEAAAKRAALRGKHKERHL